MRLLVSEVIAPILFPDGARNPPPDLPRRAIEVLDRIGDLEVRGSVVLKLLEGKVDMDRARQTLDPEDVVSKSGRRISFGLKEGRNLTDSYRGGGLHAEGPFDIEFRNAAEEFSNPEVQARFVSALKHLPEAEAADILAAAVLPQTKTLMSVKTPLNVSVMGLKASLRFGILIADHGRLKLFVIGPIVKEINI
jgi:hypothetical protein